MSSDTVLPGAMAWALQGATEAGNENQSNDRIGCKNDDGLLLSANVIV